MGVILWNGLTWGLTIVVVLSLDDCRTPTWSFHKANNREVQLRFRFWYYLLYRLHLEQLKKISQADYEDKKLKGIQDENMKKTHKRQAGEEKLTKESKKDQSAGNKKTLFLFAQKELKQQHTEVPNTFSRNSRYQETLNQITPSFKRANV